MGCLPKSHVSDASPNQYQGTLDLYRKYPEREEPAWTPKWNAGRPLRLRQMRQPMGIQSDFALRVTDTTKVVNVAGRRTWPAGAKSVANYKTSLLEYDTRSVRANGLVQTLSLTCDLSGPNNT
jgi:hypothetical protein